MHKLLFVIWIFFFILVSLAFAASVAAAFIPTSKLFPSNILSIAFPYVFVGMLLLAIANIFFFKKGWIVIVCVIALSIYNLLHIFATGNSRKFSIAKQARALRILTWNVHGLLVSDVEDPKNKVGYFKHTILTYQPDVVCLQEYMADDNFVIFMAQLGYAYTHFTWDGVAIYSKTKLSNIMLTPYNDGDYSRQMISADIIIHGKKIRMHTFHLLSYQVPKRKEEFASKSNLQYTMLRLLKVARNQHDQLAAYKDVMNKEVLPQIVCGDFNSVPCSYIYNYARKGLQDAYLKGGFGRGITFPNFLRTLRIDYILTDKRFQVQQCTVIKTLASDHYPVVADVIL